MDGENGGYREFYIINEYSTRQRYKVNIVSGTSNDGANFTEVYPKVVTINPRSKETVKLFAKVPQNTSLNKRNKT